MPALAVLLLAAAAMTAAAADPTALETHKTRAHELLDGMDFRAALLEAQEVNRLSADDIAGYELMAAAQLGLGDYSEAEKQLQWMLDLRIGKASTEGWLLLARFREITGDLDGALDIVKLAASYLASGQESERRRLMSYAARVEYLLGKLDLASQALQQSGSDPAALEVLARIRLARGNRNEAVRILQELAQSNGHPRYLYLLAEATGAAADYAAFEQAARRIAGSPDNANRELALYYAGRGKKAAEALQLARRESDRRHDVFTLDALAVALFANHKTEEARATMQRVLAVGTRDPEILQHAARLGVKP